MACPHSIPSKQQRASKAQQFIQTHTLINPYLEMLMQIIWFRNIEIQRMYMCLCVSVCASMCACVCVCIYVCVCVGGRHRGPLVSFLVCASRADGQATLRTCFSFISSNPLLHSKQAETGWGIIPLSLQSKSTMPQADYHLLRQHWLSHTASSETVLGDKWKIFSCCKRLI